MKQHIELLCKRKFIIGTFVLSIIAVAVYLILVIPHSVKITEVIQKGIRNETIITYPLSVKTYFFESLKIFCIINIPNMMIVIRKVNRKIIGED